MEKKKKFYASKEAWLLIANNIELVVEHLKDATQFTEEQREAIKKKLDDIQLKIWRDN